MSSSLPPVSNLEPLISVHCQLHSWYFMLNLLPNHVHGIISLWWMLVLKMMRHFLEPIPHSKPMAFLNVPQIVYKIIWPGGFLD
jgi:hypothetical protein